MANDKSDFQGIATEIGAGKSLVANDPVAEAWNNACDRAISIVRSYERGEGLFQMTRPSQIEKMGSDDDE